jgi:O-antigen/teichoic acid export membrane protein
VLTEPLIIVEHDPADRAILRRTLESALALAVALSVVVGLAGVGLLVAGVDVGAPLIAFAVVLPALLGQDVWRALSFGVHRPERALANDALFAAVQVVLMAVLVVVDRTSAPWFILAWGAGAAAGCAYGLVQFHAAPVARPSLALLRRLWPTSRWLLWDFLTMFGAREMYLVVVAALVTSAEFGGLRAAESLLGPSAVILLSGGNVGLPGATRAFRQGGSTSLAHYSRRLTVGVGAVQCAYCALVAAAGSWLMVAVYGSEFEPFGYLVAILAVRYAVGVAGFGPSIAVKVAGLVRQVLIARLAVTVISLPTVAVATARYGLAGGAWASVVFSIVLVLVLYAVYLPGVARATPHSTIVLPAS